LRSFRKDIHETSWVESVSYIMIAPSSENGEIDVLNAK